MDTKTVEPPPPPPPPPPYSGPSEYNLVECKHDMYDLAFNSASSSGGTAYYVHLTRSSGTPHLTIHQGSSIEAPILASLVYDNFSDGTITTHSPAVNADSKPSTHSSPWTHPNITHNIDFSSPTGPLRWTKTYQTKHRLLKPSTEYIRWNLTCPPQPSRTAEVSAASRAKRPPTPSGPVLAELDLLPPSSKSSGTVPPSGVPGTGIGRLTFHSQISQASQDAALLMVAAMVHRDRQVQAREPMGPTIDITMVARPHVMGGYALGGFATGGFDGAQSLMSNEEMERRVKAMQEKGKR
ncbi:hypothetical protein CAC42_2018 [Sphaceloma murrayae]|uniref:Uncharacterized protein n=1 Tax=Sphaceloma murrayae TaxID=2082308 RepID=A0A2K1QIS0_9PEZI|nr:hypothetical protein CAC42_2018 [Sphaceloma murrayae]